MNESEEQQCEQAGGIAKGPRTLGSSPISVKNHCMVSGKPCNLSVPQLPRLLNRSKNPIVPTSDDL